MSSSTHSRNRLKRSLLSLATLAALGAGTAHASSPAQHRWISTRTSVSQHLDAHFDGYAPDDRPVSIVVSLKLRNQDALNEYTREVSRPGSLVYRRYLSRDEAKATFAPTDEQAQKVAAYLREHGFTDVQVSSNNLLVTAKGNVGSSRQAFQTSVAEYVRGGVRAIANASEVKVPEELSQVDRVLGLDTVDQLQTYSRPPSEARPDYTVTASGAHSYDPEEFAKVYHAVDTGPALNTTVAVIGWGNMTNPQKDLAKLIADKGLPNVPTSIYSVTQTSNDDSDQVEWAMDAQAIVGISGGVKKLIFYTSGGQYTRVNDQGSSSGANTAEILKAINRAVSDNEAKVLNMSWGIRECGSSTGSGFADSAFQLGVAQGQTFVASSGDNGAYPCALPFRNLPANGTYGDRSNPQVSYPASSEFVVAVGGTTLTTTPQDAYISEKSWPYSGGGTSTLRARPAWQPTAGKGRQVPDVAFDADWDNSPIRFYVTASSNSGVSASRYVTNGGTSLSAPLFAGAWARLETANGNRLGFGAPAIWKYAASNQAKLPLRDVTTGDNGGYSAAAGWDAATGWGNFDIDAVARFIASNPGFIDATNASTKP
ncbi:protease pro-enzyme activation domain-containing protein [Luteibacter sp. CQ10]|uniref:S53 family peptidase n=1 Tax=Luteibacter sp. CQ10 TaxID=2805821 RepID=UPI0034A441D2